MHTNIYYYWTLSSFFFKQTKREIKPCKQIKSHFTDYVSKNINFIVGLSMKPIMLSNSYQRLLNSPYL